MLRLNKNRKKSTKGKQSNTEKSVEKASSRPYEENYNEVILNDLIPEEKRSEFGLQSEAPKNNKKKSSGIKLNLNLGNKKSKKTKDSVSTEKTKDSSKNKSDNKEHSSNHKEHNSNTEKIESKPSKGHKESKGSSNTNKTKTGKKKSSKPSDESKGHEKNKGSKSSKQKTKPSKGSKATKHSIVESEYIPVEEHGIVENEIKKAPRPIVNPKRRRRPEQDQNETTRSVNEELEREVEEVLEEDEESSDQMGFRGTQEQDEEVEVKEIKSKFEDLVWSEDKFPKNK